MTLAIVPLSLYLVGIAFAPLYTPHLSERFGRAPVYFATIPVCALFTLGASQAQNIATLCVCRFFAGFFGGPTLILIEGTYADVFSPAATLLYYADLTIAEYSGAICGMTETLFNSYAILTPSARTHCQRVHSCSRRLEMDAVYVFDDIPRCVPVRHRYAGDIRSRDHPSPSSP